MTNNPLHVRSIRPDALPAVDDPALGARTEYPYLDGLRGLFMLGIVLYHARALCLLPPFDGFNLRQMAWETVWCEPWPYGISCFIIISGYGSMLSALRPGRSGWAVSFAYVGRRMRRLLIPYYANIALMLGLIAITPPLLLTVSTFQNSAFQAWTPLVLISHLFLFANFVRAAYYSINPVLWSISAIFQVYLLFAFVLLPCARRFGLVWVTVAATLVSYLPLVHRPWLADVHLYYIAFFTWAMAAVALERRSWTPRQQILISRLAAGVGAFAVLTFFAIEIVLLIVQPVELTEVKPSPYEIMVCESLAGLAQIALIVYLANPAPSRAKSALASLLGHRRLKPLALVSYSLLLVHYPVLCAFRAIARFSHWNQWQSVAAIVFAGTAASLVAAWVFYFFVESRFLSGRMASIRRGT